MKQLYLMCGPAGAGKSTWVRRKMEGIPNSLHVSRDAIRFALLQDGEDYFAHEPEVLKEFYNSINDGLEKYDVVFADATHLSERTRNETLKHLNLKDVDVYAVDFNIPLDICLQQNEQRKDNMRTYVPASTVTSMVKNYRSPTYQERFKYKKIIPVRKGF